MYDRIFWKVTFEFLMSITTSGPKPTDIDEFKPLESPPLAKAATVRGKAPMRSPPQKKGS